MNKMKNPNVKLRQAYERTLEKSASCFGTATSFKCSDDDGDIDYLDCEDCLFRDNSECNRYYSFTEWQEVWYYLTGEKDERTPKDVLNSVPYITTPEEAKDIFDAQLAKIDDIVNSKFRMVYNLLGQPGEHRIESADFSLVLATINFWYKDVIKWNFIVKGKDKLQLLTN